MRQNTNTEAETAQITDSQADVQQQPANTMTTTTEQIAAQLDATYTAEGINMYSAERFGCYQIETFADFKKACAWVADGIDYEEVDNGERSYVYVVDGTLDCLGAVDTI